MRVKPLLSLSYAIPEQDRAPKQNKTLTGFLNPVRVM